MAVSEGLTAHTAERRTKKRTFAWAGVVGPVVFLGVLLLLDAIHGLVDVSGHELLSFGIVMHLNFLLFGAATICFSIELRTWLRRGTMGTIGCALIGVLGLGPVLATFTFDPGHGAPTSWHGWLHFGGFLLVSLVPLAATLVLAGGMRKDLRWRGYQWYSLLTGVAATIVVFAPDNSAPDEYPIWTGPGSMLELVLVLAWLEVLAIRVVRLSRQHGAEPQGAEHYGDHGAVHH